MGFSLRTIDRRPIFKGVHFSIIGTKPDYVVNGFSQDKKTLRYNQVNRPLEMLTMELRSFRERAFTGAIAVHSEPITTPVSPSYGSRLKQEARDASERLGCPIPQSMLDLEVLARPQAETGNANTSTIVPNTAVTPSVSGLRRVILPDYSGTTVSLSDVSTEQTILLQNTSGQIVGLIQQVNSQYCLQLNNVDHVCSPTLHQTRWACINALPQHLCPVVL